MRIYISGPMTGRKDLNRKAFNTIAAWLRKRGHFVINPHDLSPIFGSEESLRDSFECLYGGKSKVGTETAQLARAVLLADFAAIRSCDAILLLENWDTSKGAKAELLHALSLGKIVYDFTACDLNVLKKELKEDKHHGRKS